MVDDEMPPLNNIQVQGLVIVTLNKHTCSQIPNPVSFESF